MKPVKRVSVIIHSVWPVHLVTHLLALSQLVILFVLQVAVPMVIVHHQTLVLVTMGGMVLFATNKFLSVLERFLQTLLFVHQREHARPTIPVPVFLIMVEAIVPLSCVMVFLQPTHPMYVEVLVKVLVQVSILVHVPILLIGLVLNVLLLCVMEHWQLVEVYAMVMVLVSLLEFVLVVLVMEVISVVCRFAMVFFQMIQMCVVDMASVLV